MASNLQIKPLALTIDDAVKATALSRSALYGAIGRGEIVARKSGRRTIILVSDLQCWLGRLPTAPRRVEAA